jgi:2-keto-4-pentenoate hydratase/2-oxohepta-3-ene-1,7-dioic acid hydratase in catechol pathway
LITDSILYDVTGAAAVIPASSWPHPAGDPLIAHLPAVMRAASELLPSAPRLGLASVMLNSPVANPGKIMAAPANFRRHVEIDAKDPGVDLGVHYAQLSKMTAPTEELGLFLKANSSLVGPSEGVTLATNSRRSDHEVELAVVIGRAGKAISREYALDHVAGYCIGLDMTIRGVEDRSFRKSADSYTVLGPWLVTADEISDPGQLGLGLRVNGEVRQNSTTALLTVGVPRLIELASAMYTLHPGDLILTGTPEGVGPVQPGDTMTAWCDGIGEMAVRVHQASAG